MATASDESRQKWIEEKAPKLAKLIIEKGFAATSVNDIAQALGMAKAGIYHYVETKDQLLLDVIKFAMDKLEKEVVEKVEPILEPEERLRDIIFRHTEILTRYGTELAILTDEDRLLKGEEHLKDERWRKILTRRRLYLGLVRSTLKQIHSKNNLRELDADVAALNIFGTILGVCKWYEPQEWSQIIPSMLPSVRFTRSLRAEPSTAAFFATVRTLSMPASGFPCFSVFL